MTNLLDPYKDAGSAVMRNKLGATTKEALDDGEALATQTPLQDLQLRLTELAALPTREAVSEIHRTIFDPVYEWAGEFREMNTMKPRPWGTERYAGVKEIPELLDYIDSMIKDGILDVDNDDEFADKLTRIWYSLHHTHPFREGNTRTLSTYLSALAARHGRSINWGLFDADEVLEQRGAMQNENDLGPSTATMRAMLVAEERGADPDRSEDVLRPPLSEEAARTLLDRTRAMSALAEMPPTSPEIDEAGFRYLTGQIGRTERDTIAGRLIAQGARSSR